MPKDAVESLRAEYRAVRTRWRALLVSFWTCAVVGTALIFVGEFWIAAGLYLGAALIWILWMEFARGPLKTQRENALKARREAVAPDARR